MVKKLFVLMLIVQVFYLTNIYPFAHRHNIPHHHHVEVSECCGNPDNSFEHSQQDTFTHFHEGCGPDCHRQEEGNHFDPDSFFLISKVLTKLNPQPLNVAKTIEHPVSFDQQEALFPVLQIDTIPTLFTYITTFSRRGPPSVV